MTNKFVDTNVLVYAALSDEKRSATALSLMAAGGVISVQVLNEFTDVMRRKLKMSWQETRAGLALAKTILTVMPLTVEVQAHAVDLASRHNFRIFDATILASALAADCDALYSEDMHHGLVVENRLTIVNPFA